MLALPEPYRKLLRTTNGLERLNAEIPPGSHLNWKTKDTPPLVVNLTLGRFPG